VYRYAGDDPLDFVDALGLSKDCGLAGWRCINKAEWFILLLDTLAFALSVAALSALLLGGPLALTLFAWSGFFSLYGFASSIWLEYTGAIPGGVGRTGTEFGIGTNVAPFGAKLLGDSLEYSISPLADAEQLYWDYSHFSQP